MFAFPTTNAGVCLISACSAACLGTGGASEAPAFSSLLVAPDSASRQKKLQE